MILCADTGGTSHLDVFVERELGLSHKNLLMINTQSYLSSEIS